MLKPTLLLLLVSQLTYCQENKVPTTYKHGYNGMELIIKSKKETIIVSTFNSKLKIKDEIAQKIYDLYRLNSFVNGDILNITGDVANVIGKCFIKKKGNLVLIDFYYEEIQWKSGLVEAYDD